MFESMPAETVHVEPVIRIPWRRGHRMFVLLGASAFVVVSFLALWIGGYSLLTETPLDGRAVIAVVAGLLGFVFFGGIAIGVMKNFFGRQNNTAVILSRSGVTDQTQIIGPLPTMPWSMIAQYDIAEYQRQLFLVLQLRDVERYQQIIGSSRTLRVAFKFNSKIFGVPVHAITLKNLSGRPEDVIGALYAVTNVLPGHPIGRPGEPA